MKLKELGRTGILVSPICFGSLTMSPLQHNYSPEQAARVIAFAAQQGINFIDTAEYYQNYPLLAAALQQVKTDLVITSKTYSYEYEQAVTAVEQARKALGRDVIDIFMLHEQESEHTMRGHKPALDALYDLKAKGVIRAVGISTHYVAGVEAAIKFGVDVVHPMLNKTGLGICDGGRAEMERAVKKAHDSGIGVYSMKAFGGGNLYQSAQECLHYIFGLDYIDSVALGMKSQQEILDNLSFYQTGSFTPSYCVTGKKLHIEEYCTGCGNCVKRCPQKALQIKSGRAQCNHKECLLCGYCSAVCTDFAIKIL